MSLEDLEATLKKWEEEIRVFSPKETCLRPKHIKRLKKEIDKIYRMNSMVRIYEEKIEAWARGEIEI
jgi:transposase